MFKAIGDISKKIYGTGDTKAELMRKLHVKYKTQPQTLNAKNKTYPEPLWIERF